VGNDKTYMWLAILTFLALLGAFGLALAEWKDYTDLSLQTFKIPSSPN